MIKKLQQYPLFFLLLPVFFVFHGFVENHSFIHFTDCWSLMGIYTGAAIILYAIGYGMLKNRARAALFSAYIMGFYLFFGALHDFLRLHDIFLHKYSILLPCFAFLAAVLILYGRRHPSPLPRLTLFLNVLLILYIVVDAGSLGWKLLHKTSSRSIDLFSMSTPLTRCDTCAKPDIYLILFDCYSGNKTLKDEYRYDNSAFHRFLEQEGFRVQKSSFSNYTSTPSSMASMLNFTYLLNLHISQTARSDEFADMVGYIGKSRVVNFLYSQGYTIVNYSPFDLPGNPSSLDQGFVPVKTRLITNRTLWGYIMRDLQTWIVEHFEDSAILSGSRIAETDHMNRQFLASAKEESARRSPRPRFIYTHVFMPHFPFFYDSLMQKRSLPDLAAHEDEDDPAYYLQYLPYANAAAKELITTIKKNTDGKAVILFMSDHGLRSRGYKNKSHPFVYNNQNAIYFPDGDYSSLYDSISNVNQFRVVFNKLFHQGLPLLKDSTARFLSTDKE